MTTLKTMVTDWIRVKTQGSKPATPAAGFGIFYTKAKSPYFQNEDGTETNLISTATGDVVGPASATADHLVVFNGTTGKLVKDGGIGTKVIQVALNGSTALTVSDKAYFRIPSLMNGCNLVNIAAMCVEASSSGTPTFTVKKGATSMLTTSITIDAGEYDSSTAAVAAVIDTAHDDVATATQIGVACSVAGTGVTYAVVELTFALP